MSSLALVDHNFGISSLLLGSDGAFYGSVVNYGDTDTGRIFRLRPPASGSSGWVETILFASHLPDAFYPTIYTLDRGLSLFGSIMDNNFAGSTFRLSPVDAFGTKWAFSTLYHSTGSFVTEAYGLAEDRDRALFGVTDKQINPKDIQESISQGTVFKLVPPASGLPWHQTTLAIFPNDPGFDVLPGLLQTWFKPDGSRVFFGFLPLGTAKGGTLGAGKVFEIVP